MLSGTKQRGTDPHMRRSIGRADQIVAAHSHRKLGEPRGPGQFRQQGKVRPGRFLDGRNAHQADNIEAAFVPGDCQEVIEFRGRHAGLLRLFARIDLNEVTAPKTQFRLRLGHRPAQLWPVQRLDHIEQTNGIFRLVGLQGSDQAQLKIGNSCAPVCPSACAS